MLGSEQLYDALRIGTVVLPVAVYFLLLGLLNSRRRPQLLSARQDAALLTVALLPLLFAPLTALLGGTGWVLGACLAIAAATVACLAPHRDAWVLYNLSADQARDLCHQSLLALDIRTQSTPEGLRSEDDRLRLDLSGFWLLRNVSLRMNGANRQLAERFEEELTRRLRRIDTDPHPMAVSLLLVSTVMIVGPLALVVDRVPEIVRLLGDLLG